MRTTQVAAGANTRAMTASAYGTRPVYTTVAAARVTRPHLAAQLVALRRNLPVAVKSGKVQERTVSRVPQLSVFRQLSVSSCLSLILIFVISTFKSFSGVVLILNPGYFNNRLESEDQERNTKNEGEKEMDERKKRNGNERRKL